MLVILFKRPKLLNIHNFSTVPLFLLLRIFYEFGHMINTVKRTVCKQEFKKIMTKPDE